MEAVISSNSDAVEAITGGKYRKSICALETALRRLKASLLSDEASPTITSELDEQMVEHLHIKFLTLSWKPDNSVDCIPVFDRAIQIETDNPSQLLDETDHSSVSIALLYNLALSRHLHGIDLLQRIHPSLPGAKFEFQRALAFYELALSTIGGDDVTDLERLVMLAILNNMGHIYSTYFYDIEKVQGCGGMIRELLSGAAITSRVWADEFEDFRTYLSVFCIGSIFSSPSA